MGKITIDEMHNSLFDYAQAVSDESLMTESKTIVGAINEIYGKNLIADSIGEPLNNTDTFTKMSDDINNLLSTFKTNIMNAGIAVESGDKFKTLIDKIKGLTEGEGNKGIKYAEGIIDVENVTLDNDKWLTYEIPYNIDFDPTILLICISKWGMSSTNKNDCILVICDKFSNSEDTATRFKVPNMTETYLECYITNTTSTGCTLNYYTTSSTWDNIGGFSYVAIGVGEEDTTLRDSLASILEDEGVEVTEEDDMATLISKVDEEFDRQVVPVGDATVEDVIAGKTFMNNMGELLTGALVSGLNKIKQDSLRTDTPAGKTLVVSATNIGFKPSIVIIFCGNASSICIAIQDELFSSFPLNGYMFTPTYSIGAGYLNALGTSSGDDYYILNNRFKLTIPIHDVGPATVSWIAIGR